MRVTCYRGAVGLEASGAPYNPPGLCVFCQELLGFVPVLWGLRSSATLTCSSIFSGITGGLSLFFGSSTSVTLAVFSQELLGFVPGFGALPVSL